MNLLYEVVLTNKRRPNSPFPAVDMAFQTGRYTYDKIVFSVDGSRFVSDYKSHRPGQKLSDEVKGVAVQALVERVLDTKIFRDYFALKGISHPLDG